MGLFWRYGVALSQRQQSTAGVAKYPHFAQQPLPVVSQSISPPDPSRFPPTDPLSPSFSSFHMEVQGKALHSMQAYMCCLCEEFLG